jgi:hypothetical protein
LTKRDNEEPGSRACPEDWLREHSSEMRAAGFCYLDPELDVVVHVFPGGTSRVCACGEVDCSHPEGWEVWRSWRTRWVDWSRRPKDPDTR